MRPRLHVVALAHLDTQWRWTARDTAREHLPRTVDENEALFARHPRYVLSFEGAWRYRLLAEHDPGRFERVRARVREGRWFPAGAAFEAFDSLIPAPESILRQILYGTRWFERELGRAGRDLFLPDCFGFPVILPTLAVHAGIVGFSTQKLRRGDWMRSAFGIPFAYGRWRGPDGAELLAALDPGEYSGRIESDLSRDPSWIARFAELAAGGGGSRLLYYVGTGDRGGAPPEPTVARLEESLASDGPVDVRHGPSEQIYLDTGAEERARLPVYAGELLLQLHGTGCYTAKASLKRWNRIGERLARAAEAAWALARLEGATPPVARLARAWETLLAHQMHDDLTGTSIPAAYQISLDALGWAANELSELLLDGVARTAAGLDLATAQEGLCLALSVTGAPRDELLEIALGPGERPRGAVAGSGEPLPLQLVERPGEPPRALVPLATGGVELSALRLVAAARPAGAVGESVAAGAERLESDRYLARFDEHGRLASLEDLRLGRELLAAPLELELLPDRSRKYPAWEIEWRDASARPLATVRKLLRREVVEHGPLRVALRIEREARECRVRETWSLAAAPWGPALVCEVELEWHARGRLLKLRVPAAARNESASYDTGLGAIARPVASERLWEVPAQHWAAIEDESGDFGLAVLSDVRSGWDHPEPGTLRLTWIHAPRASWKFRHQATQDFGRHRFRFALAGFARGELAGGDLAGLADGFVHPSLAFRAEPGGRAGGGSRRRLLALGAPGRLLAAKTAEEGDDLVCRFANASASPAAIEPAFAEEIAGVVEADGLERARPADGAAAPLDGGRLPPSGLRTLRLAPRAPATEREAGDFLHLPLPWSTRGFSRNGERLERGFDGRGNGFPLELVPDWVDDGPVPFDLGHLTSPAQVAIPGGEELELRDRFAELWLLAAAIDGDRRLGFRVGATTITVEVPAWRLPFLRESRARRWLFGLALDPGRFRRVPVAVSTGHLHDRRGADRPVERAALFAVRVPLHGERRITFPRSRAVRMVAATLARSPARPLAEAAPPLLP